MAETVRNRLAPGGHRFKVALYDVEIDADGAPALAELLAAYRRWCNQ